MIILKITLVKDNTCFTIYICINHFEHTFQLCPYCTIISFSGSILSTSSIFFSRLSSEQYYLESFHPNTVVGSGYGRVGVQQHRMKSHLQAGQGHAGRSPLLLASLTLILTPSSQSRSRCSVSFPARSNSKYWPSSAFQFLHYDRAPG